MVEAKKEELEQLVRDMSIVIAKFPIEYDYGRGRKLLNEAIKYGLYVNKSY